MSFHTQFIVVSRFQEDDALQNVLKRRVAFIYVLQACSNPRWQVFWLDNLPNYDVSSYREKKPTNQVKQ